MVVSRNSVVPALHRHVKIKGNGHGAGKGSPYLKLVFPLKIAGVMLHNVAYVGDTDAGFALRRIVYFLNR